ncbi:MAG: DNA translocase FtsK [Myxococcota bacterium]|nr:DNA translocase FtsK [Myxococcota bacterium]
MKKKRSAPPRKKARRVKRGSAVLSRGGSKTSTRTTAVQSIRRTAVRLRSEIGAVAVLGFGILLLLSVLSYHPRDSRAGLWGATDGAGEVHNWAGPFGAAVAEVFVGLLGLTAFLLPVLLGLLVLALLGRRTRRPAFWELTGLFGVLGAVAVMVQLVFPTLAFRGEVVTGGGLLGEVLAGGLVGWISEPGTWVVSATVFMISARLCFGIQFLQMFRLLGGKGVALLWAGARRLGLGLRSGVRWLAGAVSGLGAWAREVIEDWRHERSMLREERLWEREDQLAQRDADVRERENIERETGALLDDADWNRGGTLAEDAGTDSVGDSLAETDSLVDGIRAGSRVRLPEPAELDLSAVESDSSSAPGIELSDSVAPSSELDEELKERTDSMCGAAARGVVHAELQVGAAELSDENAPDPVPAGSVSSSDVEMSSAPSASDSRELSVPETTTGPRIRPIAAEEREARKVDRVVSQRRKIRLRNEPFEHPQLSLLEMPPSDRAEIDENDLERQAQRLEETLSHYGIEGRVTDILPGPVVTMFEFEPAPGIKVARIANLGDDLAMALRAVKVRIVAPIPGKGAVGIEIPSTNREMVYFREILASKVFRKGTAQLPLAMGKGIDGSPVTSDLAKMPHMIVAGTTGSGKSVCVNTLILSLVYSRSPDEVRLILVDPKMLEFSIYDGIPHLLVPVVTSPKKAAVALKWAVEEMQRRYQVLSAMGARNIVNYNQKSEELQEQWATWEKSKKGPDDRPDCGRMAGEDTVCFRSEGGDPVGPPEKMPYIVIIIDELADLMMVAKKDVEESIVRLAQMARASGIHMVLATQRPSVDVITGLIKANFPTRLSFKVSSKTDSRTVLDANGAESLLGLGDGLFLPPGMSELTRVHGAFVSDDEVKRVVDYLKTQGEADYVEAVLVERSGGAGDEGSDDSEFDSMYDECVAVVAQAGKASTSLLQRKLKLGYNRAARIMDRLEEQGVIGPQDGARPREVYVKPYEL